MDQQTAAAIGRPGTERLLRLLTWAESRVRAETESVKAARSAPEGPGLEGRGFGRYAGNGGAHGCFSSHAPLPRGEREEGLGGGTPSHIKAGVPEEIPTMCVQKEYSVNYAFRCLKTVDMYRIGEGLTAPALSMKGSRFYPAARKNGGSFLCPGKRLFFPCSQEESLFGRIEGRLSFPQFL